LKLLRQLALGRQTLAALESSIQDGIAQLGGDVLMDAAAQRRPEGHDGTDGAGHRDTQLSNGPTNCQERNARRAPPQPSSRGWPRAAPRRAGEASVRPSGWPAACSRAAGRAQLDPGDAPPRPMW